MSSKTNSAMQRFIEVNGEVFRVTRSQSIFTNRSGKIDIRISGRGNWGTKANDGYLYNTRQCLDYETGERVGNFNGNLPERFPLNHIFEDSFFNCQEGALQ